ncbi:MAG TPA: hypothetical protein VIZ65_09495 [Cellvibrionaceae bacterium]
MTKRIKILMRNKVLFSLMLYVFCSLLLARQVYGVENNSYRVYMNEYCNFFITDLCVGLNGGDELKISIPIDYSIYDLKFKTGVKVRIYVGFNPKVEDYIKGKHEKCDGDECYLHFNIDAGQGFVLYKESKSKYPNYVHFIFDGLTKENFVDVEKFLIDTKKCTFGKVFKCTRDSPFESAIASYTRKTY